MFLKKPIRLMTIGVSVLALGLAGCGSDSDEGSTPDASASGGAAGAVIPVGFAQVGAESGWRAANTKSIQDALTTANGFDLKFSDAQQKQENQIQAIRSYIAQGVKYIAFSPVVVSGWDEVLGEAKAAGIPVILTDRAVDVADKSLYVTFIGSDFVEEGRRIGEYVSTEFGTEPINVVELQGTTGSAPAIDRKTGFENAIKENPNVKVIASQTGNFTRAEGKTVMEGFLQAHKDIDVVYAHNDDMGLGAIEAIEATTKEPGKDIKVVTIDGVKDGMTALAAGKINYIVECNPLLGPALAEIIKTLDGGGTVEPRIVTEDGAFNQEQAKEALPTRQY